MMKFSEGLFCKWRHVTVGLTILLSSLLISLPASAHVVLVDRGEPAAVIVLPEEPAEPEQQAAEELVEHIRLMSGARLPVTAAGEILEGLLPIFIGAAADDALENLIREQGDDSWSFALIAEADGIQLRGLSPEGTRTAAYELLEQLGVRWFMPGETGREIPETQTLTLAIQRTLQSPSFQLRFPIGGRNQPHLETWSRRARLGGVGRRAGGHGIAPIQGRARAYFESNPEFFAVIDGERRRRQLCLTNPELIEVVVAHYRDVLRRDPETGLAGRTGVPPILHMGPNDGGGYCECTDCTALDPPRTTPLATPGASMTDRYVWFFNRLLEGLDDEFPDARVAFYVYARHLLPPLNQPMDPKRYAVSITPIHACRLHGPNNPVCPESNVFTWLYEAWEPYAEERWDQGYFYNLACPGFPFSTVHRLREEIPLGKRLGTAGWAPGGGPPSAWASHNPSYYVMSRLMWDHTADVDAILDDFSRNYYGPAAEPMAEYHTLMDAAIRDADHHTGSSWDMPHIYPSAVRESARRHIAQAETLAAASDHERFALRVAITRGSLDFLDAYCDIIDRRNRHDFIAEKEAFDRLWAIRNMLVEDYEFPMLVGWHSETFIRAFISGITEANVARVTDGNELIAPFRHEWQFQTDPENWGRYIGLHKPDSEGGNWRTIRTDTSWSNQGLRYYFGQAWYRQTVDLPAGTEGRRIMIGFSGVDRTAEVWVNGHWVGANHDGAEFDLDAHGSAFVPFAFDVTDAIRPGEPNTVTVRTYRTGTSELGTGGIIGPVMFYASVAVFGDDSKVDKDKD